MLLLSEENLFINIIVSISQLSKDEKKHLKNLYLLKGKVNI